MGEVENPQTAAERKRILAAVAGRRVLITGAAGFIGTALVRFLAECAPEELVLLDLAESGLHDLALELDRRADGSHEEIVGDVCDVALLQETFSRFRPQVVVHAAACKHVPLMERNPFTAAKTNVLGTQRLLQAAVAAGVETLVSVSTDKAVEPTSIMGATKRIAEELVSANASSTRMSVVRLANVWRSSGSVVPIIERQIAQGGPITITDPECERYFLPVEVAVRRVLYALAIGGRASLFVAETGAAQRIQEIADELVRDAGVTRESVEVRWIGLRPGEKITESMVADDECVSAEAAGGLYELLASPRPPTAELDAALSEIGAAVETRNLAQLLRAVQRAAPDYRPSEYLQERSRRSGIKAGVT